MLLLASCVNEADIATEEQHNGKFTLIDNEDNYVKGWLRFQISEDAGAINITRSGSHSYVTDIPELNQMLAELGAVKIKRMVPYDERYEEGYKKYGIDRWYDVFFDKSVSLTRATRSIAEIDAIEFVESMPKIQSTGKGSVFTPALEPSPMAQNYSTRSGSDFNDPRLSEQWHYHNTGVITNSLAGSDINLFNAWTLTTGSSDVIVAVLDSGIDYEHEDLAANIWVNQGEVGGASDTDNDGNGYKNDVHGYNFCYDDSYNHIGVIDTSGDGAKHGTHVAGTVAAVNNNGIGVSGIAGGDGSGNGVKIMICQIINADESASDAASALIYAANNGAVIAQNSWGYQNATSMPASLKTAIDYFISNNSNTLISGGVVIFAAGNDGTSTMTYPAAYEEVVSVAALGIAYDAASYTNYGTWVTLSAPGGNASDATGVLSLAPGDSYAFNKGTSMACPHVSGIAALAVSHLAGSGLTGASLKALLTNGTTDMIYDYNTFRVGKLGTGLIDAAMVLGVTDFLPPYQVTFFGASWRETSATVIWNTVIDGQHNVVNKYELLVSKSSISQSDFESIPADAQHFTIELTNPGLAERASLDITGLDKGTKYYVAIVAVDDAGKKSDLKMAEGTTTGTSTTDPDPDPDPEVPENNISGYNISLYPNPVVGDTLNVALGESISGTVEISVFNTAGTKVFTQTTDNVTGNSVITCNVSKMSSGTYVMKFNHSNGTIKSSFTKL